MPASVSIIGGADGPTAIFVSGSWMPITAVLAIAIAAVVILIIKKRKK